MLAPRARTSGSPSALSSPVPDSWVECAASPVGSSSVLPFPLVDDSAIGPPHEKKFLGTLRRLDVFSWGLSPTSPPMCNAKSVYQRLRDAPGHPCGQENFRSCLFGLLVVSVTGRQALTIGNSDARRGRLHRDGKRGGASG